MLYTLHEYVERKQFLERPSEQSRLLHEFPEIITDETEIETTEKQYSRKVLLPESDSGKFSKPSQKDSKEHEQQHHSVSSHESIDGGIDQAVIKEPVPIQEKVNFPEASQSNFALPKTLKTKQREPISEMIEDEQTYNTIGESKKTKPELPKPSAEDSGSGADFREHEQQYEGPESEELEQRHHSVSSHENNLLPEEPDTREFSKVSSTKELGEHEQQYQVPESEELEQLHHTVSSHESNDGGIHEEVINEPALQENHPEASHSPITSQPNSGLPNKGRDPPPEMIEISDDDDEGQANNTIRVSKKPVEVSDDKKQDTTSTIGVSKKAVDDNLDSSIWYCVSPHGGKGGPYSMSLLKEHTTDTFSSELKFKVWKCGQSPEEAIFLTDAIRQFSGAK